MVTGLDALVVAIFNKLSSINELSRARWNSHSKKLQRTFDAHILTHCMLHELFAKISREQVLKGSDRMIFCLIIDNQ